MKRILVPCDFSESAIEAFSFAMSIAERTAAEISVLKVIDLPFMYQTTFGFPTYHSEPGIINRLEEEATMHFERLREKYSQKATVTFRVLPGPITDTVRQFISDYSIDLVVMGTLGASGWKEYFVGSNTEKIVRYSNVPVFAIRKARALKQIKNIVFPTTLEFNQIDLVKRVTDLQAFFSAMLHILLINTPSNMNRSRDEMEMLEEYVHHYDISNYTLNTRNDFYEQDGIMNFAHEIKADMIAMGTHSRRGLAHLFMGSVTEDVVNHVDCPIWTYSIRK